MNLHRLRTALFFLLTVVVGAGLALSLSGCNTLFASSPNNDQVYIISRDFTPITSMTVGQVTHWAAQEYDPHGQLLEADIKYFNWTSTDPTVATVDSNANVTAIAPGTAVITASDPHTGDSGSITITVTAATP